MPCVEAAAFALARSRDAARDLAALHAGNNPLEADIGCAEHAPRDFTRHLVLPFAISAAQ